MNESFNNNAYMNGRRDAVANILKSINQGILEEREFADMQIKDANWKQFLEYFIHNDMENAQ